MDIVVRYMYNSVQNNNNLMKKVKWFFLSNVFRKLADRSMVRFYKFCYLFMLGLSSNVDDPFYDLKYQELLPFIAPFNAAYDIKYGNKGQRKGDTKKFNQLFKQLSSVKLHSWDIALQAVFQQNTPEYTKIFPNGLTPFHTYSISDRFDYFKNAVTEIAKYPALLALHTEMAAFFADFKLAEDVKQKKNINIKESKDEVLTLARIVADEIYGVLGDFMKKFRKKPENILAFFPVFLLRQRKKGAAPDPSIIELSINSSESIEAGYNFGHNDSLNFYDTGDTNLVIWFTPDPLAAKPLKLINLIPQGIKTIKVSDYASQADRFMMVENTSIDDIGSLEISLN